MEYERYAAKDDCPVLVQQCIPTFFMDVTISSIANNPDIPEFIPWLSCRHPSGRYIQLPGIAII
jgi:hypothetical protein